MRRISFTITCFFLFGIGVLFPGSPATDAPVPVQLHVPEGWPTPNPKTYHQNPPTAEGIALGRRLFYDPRLSKDSTVACASCHQQSSAFASSDHDFSHGIGGNLTQRNAPGLFNLAWNTHFHWDGGIRHIELQPLAPLTNAQEMGENLPRLLKKLQADTGYVRQFKLAFKDGKINSRNLLKALSQFTGLIQSYQSKYDRVKMGTGVFTKMEKEGYQLFLKHCNACHTEPLFTDHSFRNNGLVLNAYLKDVGRMGITQSTTDSLTFKVPSLRNVTVTYPYMHDGRMYTLEQVLDHYRHGIHTEQPTLDPLLKNRIAMTDAESRSVLAFLETLRDDSLLRNPQLQQPADLRTVLQIHR